MMTVDDVNDRIDCVFFPTVVKLNLFVQNLYDCLSTYVSCLVGLIFSDVVTLPIMTSDSNDI